LQLQEQSQQWFVQHPRQFAVLKGFVVLVQGFVEQQLNSVVLCL
jgi:hypothetical protein